MTEVDKAVCRDIREGSDRKVWEILQAVCDETGICAGDVLGPSRMRPIARARQLVMFIANRDGLSLTVIARVLGRDHTTVLHGVKAEAARRARP